MYHIDSANREHYYVFVRGTDDDKWLCNDSVVTTASAKNVLTSGAYILSYARQCGAGVG
ncbi:unnamed protein product [Laminaria digitata]